MHYIDHLNKGNLLQRVTYSDVNMNVRSTRNIRFNSLLEVVLPLKHLNRCTHCYCHILSFIRTLYLTNYIIYFRSFWNWLIYKKHLIKRKCFFFNILSPRYWLSKLALAYLWTFFRFTSPPLMKSRKFDGSSGFAAFKSTMALPSFISSPSFLFPSLVNWTKRMAMSYIYFQRSTSWPHQEYGASERQYLYNICMWNTFKFHSL